MKTTEFITKHLNKMESACEEVAELLKALSHPQRLMILCHLIEGKKSVMELVDACQISQSQMSQFLGRLKRENLIQCERSGAFQLYSIKDNRLKKLMGFLQKTYCK